MPVLRISLLGPFLARLDDQPVYNFRTNKVQALLIYLAVERGRPHQREALMTLLWPDMPLASAQVNLRQTIYRLRQAIPQVDCTTDDSTVPLLLADRQTVQLNPKGDIRLDVEEFQAGMDADPAAAAALYRGDFLADFFLVDSNAFEDWAESSREKLRRQAIAALDELAQDSLAKGEYPQALSFAWRRIDIDPLSESAYRVLMQALVGNGQRNEAISQYQSWRRRIKDELGVEPGAEIAALYSQIQADSREETPPRSEAQTPARGKSWTVVGHAPTHRREARLDLVAQSSRPAHMQSGKFEHRAPASTGPRNNLTSQPTTFVGRQEEIADLERLLADPEIRLVTIVGPGGMGKTRLALEVAERQTRPTAGKYPFPDGVFFVPLAAVSSPEHIIPAIAKALNIPLDTGQSAEIREMAAQATSTQKTGLISYLWAKRILLVLDNLEHLLDGIALLSELLEALPALQVLATSRERLQIQEEQVYPIQGLDFPDWEAPDFAAGYTAMELFLQSARRNRPDFELDTQDMVYLTRICRLVGGMPLGLELAASWVDMLSLEEIAAEIQSSLDFLETEMRNIPDRHRSMRAVFDSTWRQLSPAEKNVFPRLSVFRGHFTRSAAQEVAQASLRTLASLVNKSLLKFDQGLNRYQLHELLRQYGAGQLDLNPEDAFETGRRHSDYFCSIVAQHLNLLHSGQSQVALDLYGLDSASIQVAWDWAVENGAIELVDRALDGICTYYEWSMREEEGLAKCQAALDMLLSQGSGMDSESVLAKRLHVKLILWQGYFNLYFQHDQAIRFLTQSESMIEQLMSSGIDVRTEKSDLLVYQGVVNFLTGELAQAKEAFEGSLALSREIGRDWGILRSLLSLGDVARAAGAPSEAKVWYNRSLTETRAREHLWGEIASLNALGWAARSLMSYQEAILYYEESIELANANQNHWEVARGLQSLGFLSLFLGQFDLAIERFKQAVSIAEEQGAPFRASASHTHIGVGQWLSGEFDQAEQTLTAALSLVQEYNPAERLWPEICLTEYLVMMGRYRQAAERVRLMDAATQGLLLDRFTEGRRARVLGWIALAERDYAKARQHFEASIEVYLQIADDEQVAWSQAGLAAAAIQQGRQEEAFQILYDALWTAVEIQGVIPLLFTLPFVCLYLLREDPEQARLVYARMQASPFLAQAPIFADIVDAYLPQDFKRAAARKDAVAAGSDLPQSLWSIASQVLSSWIQAWMEEPEAIYKP